MRKQNRDRRPIRAAWALVLLTTLCAELTFTAVAVPATWLLLPLLLVMYGAGVLLIREVVVRVGGGWPSLVLLGLAYQLAEDGLGLQALTSPDMYGAADWGLRAGGINWTYWEGQIGVHVMFSVLVPLALHGLIFPDLRGRPLVGNRGLIGVGVSAVLGVLGLRFIISAFEDSGYQALWGWTLVFIAAIAGLAWLALRVLPRRRLGPAAGGRAPRPAVVGFVGVYLTMAFLSTLIPLGLGDDLLFGDKMSPGFRLVASAITLIAFGYVVLRWSLADNWDDRRLIWLIGGILVSHTAFMMPASVVAIVLGPPTIVAEVVLLMWLAKRVSARQAVMTR